MVHGVGGHGEDGAGGKVVGVDGDARPRGNEAWEAERGGRVDAEGFENHVVEAVGRGWDLAFGEIGSDERRVLDQGGRGEENILGQILHHLVFWNHYPLRYRLVEFLLQVLHHAWRFQRPV